MNSDNSALRNDVRKLGDLLGETLVRQEGSELLNLVESVRLAVREGKTEEVLTNLSVEKSEIKDPRENVLRGNKK